MPDHRPEHRFASPITTVDVVLLCLRGDFLQVALLRRAAQPFAGELALPGGYVHVHEDFDTQSAAKRVLREKLHLTSGYFLEQLYTFSGPTRDPRGWSLSVAYYAVIGEKQFPGTATMAPADAVGRLPFDHNKIVEAAVYRLRSKATYSSLPAFLLPELFTLRELHSVYQRVLGQTLDLASFRRKIEEQGIAEPAAGKIRSGPNRPAQLYRLSARTLQQFNRVIVPMDQD